MPRILQEIGTDGQHIAAAEPTRLEQDIYGVVEGAVGGKGALLTKKAHEKKKNRQIKRLQNWKQNRSAKLMHVAHHFEGLGSCFSAIQFGWLQGGNLRFSAFWSEVWMWPVSHDSYGIIYLQKRAASFRNIPQRWVAGKVVENLGIE